MDTRTTTPGTTAGTRPLMRAAVARRFGGPEVVRVESVPRPTARAGELVLRVHASTVSAADHRMRARDLPKGMWFMAPIALGVFRPRVRVLGMDAAGVVAEVGPGVESFQVGDRVVARLGSAFGGHAQYARVRVGVGVARIPEGMSFVDAAAVPFGGLTALHFLREAGVTAGSDVLVNGASGAVGTAVVQLATALGARVTAVCGDGADLVRGLGADAVVDYRTEDLAAGTATYDVVVDCVGTAPVARVEHLVRPGGAFALVAVDAAGLLGAGRARRRTGKRVVVGNITVDDGDLASLLGLVEEGRLRPVVDRTYPLDDVVAAHAYVDTWHKKGSVVLEIS
ncbi:NAD(P)-dependent alcohol dehydrogenase [Actinotalea fermentans]|uniref:Alcohol dehydrogenase n=1 Tax=Actinotalea fermentans TaxID=43671 RepID=A0A511YZ01_9CELL|nr:NAD(P)-dependent alcohol dehydrogenase [Actinotalea fermentans]GEN80423.1 alcohol dehydrogenase [Actinotalea fermentans]